MEERKKYFDGGDGLENKYKVATTCDSWGDRYARYAILEMLVGECGGIIDFVLMACVNCPNWITCSFNELKSQETPPNPT